MQRFVPSALSSGLAAVLATACAPSQRTQSPEDALKHSSQTEEKLRDFFEQKVGLSLIPSSSEAHADGSVALLAYPDLAKLKCTILRDFFHCTFSGSGAAPNVEEALPVHFNILDLSDCDEWEISWVSEQGKVSRLTGLREGVVSTVCKRRMSDPQ